VNLARYCSEKGAKLAEFARFAVVFSSLAKSK
jgi:hypothetical protein